MPPAPTPTALERSLAELLAKHDLEAFSFGAYRRDDGSVFYSASAHGRYHHAGSDLQANTLVEHAASALRGIAAKRCPPVDEQELATLADEPLEAL